MNYCTRSLKYYNGDLVSINTSKEGSLNITFSFFEDISDHNTNDFFLVVDTKTSNTYFYQWMIDVETDLFISQYIEGFLKTARRTIWEF